MDIKEITLVLLVSLQSLLFMDKIYFIRLLLLCLLIILFTAIIMHDHTYIQKLMHQL